MKKTSRLRLSVGCLLGMALLLLGTASCAALPFNPPWVYTDLRALGSLDAPSPATDILAVYTRTTDLTVDIRVDLLDINPGDDYSLKLVLWDDRNFSHNPLTIDLASTGQVQTTGISAGQPDIWPRVIQDFGLDTVTVSLNRAFIGAHYRLNVFTYTTTPPALADQILNVRSDAQPPAQRAHLLVAFSDAFPVTTPAQALRRWDGAHTGPLGGRHGLKYVLDAAGKSDIPVALLDLKNPASLAALSFMGDIPEIKYMITGGLLILPDVVYGEPADVALASSRRAAVGFGLPSSQFVYTLSSNPSVLAGYPARFMPLSDNTHLASSAGTRLIPLPSAEVAEATADGPALDVRRTLFTAALSPDPATLVVLGGSLPNSTWGEADMAYPTFAWIAAHPWIQPLTGQDLLTFPTRAYPAASLPGTTAHPWLKALQAAPDNIATRSAWQAYLTLTAPGADTQLQALRSTYLGQVGELLAAANWAKKPAPRADCTHDLKADGQLECILANRTFFAVLEPDGARLTQFFYLDASGPHQLVGPSSQFAVGLSDPSEWEPQNGEAADPSVIPGAFTDDMDTWMDYTPTPHAGAITFTSPDGSRVKPTGWRHRASKWIIKVPRRARWAPASRWLWNRRRSILARPIIRPPSRPIPGLGTWLAGVLSRLPPTRSFPLRVLSPRCLLQACLKIQIWSTRREIISRSLCRSLPSRGLETLAYR